MGQPDDHADGRVKDCQVIYELKHTSGIKESASTLGERHQPFILEPHSNSCFYYIPFLRLRLQTDPASFIIPTIFNREIQLRYPSLSNITDIHTVHLHTRSFTMRFTIAALLARTVPHPFLPSSSNSAHSCHRGLCANQTQRRGLGQRRIR